MTKKQHSEYVNVYDMSSKNTDRLRNQGYERVELTAEIEPLDIRHDETLMVLLRELVRFPKGTSIGGVATAYQARSKDSRFGPPDISIQRKECESTDLQKNNIYVITFNSKLITRKHLEELATQIGAKIK